VYHHRAAAARDVEEALHPQEIGAAQRDQGLHAARKGVPRQRRVVGEDEAGDAVAVLGLGDEAGTPPRTRVLAGVALAAVALDQAARIEIAFDRSVDAGVRIERAQTRGQPLDALALGEIGL